MRVIAGRARGIALKTIEGLETRPTTDRVKEAMFSMIHPRIYGAVGIDLFAGSGAIGIELLSRGALSVTFVESNRALETIIRHNLEKTHLSEGASLVIDDYEKSLSKIKPESVDLIIMDPPYDKGLILKALNQIAERSLLKTEGWVVIEHLPNDSDLCNIPPYFVKLKEKKYGKIGVTVLRRAL